MKTIFGGLIFFPRFDHIAMKWWILQYLLILGGLFLSLCGDNSFVLIISSILHREYAFWICFYFGKRSVFQITDLIGLFFILFSTNQYSFCKIKLLINNSSLLLAPWYKRWKFQVKSQRTVFRICNLVWNFQHKRFLEISTHQPNECFCYPRPP